MSKKKKNDVSLLGENEKLILEYNLFDLPTAQHKAGLVGLLMVIESMKLREMSPLPEVLECTATNAKIAFTKESMQAICNYLFDAVWVETPTNKKRTDSKKQIKEPKRIEEEEITLKNGKKKKKTIYIYDDPQPVGKFLFYPEDSAWVDLWRDLLRNILRIKPASRGLYEDRAKEISLPDAEYFWRESQKKENNNIFKKEIKGTIFLGAEAKNAEQIPFQGTIERNFLLHFWTIPSLIFVLRLIELKRKDKSISLNFNKEGFAIAIPEPSDLKIFVEETIKLLNSLSTKVEKNGHRPEKAIIDLPEEGGLEYLRLLTMERIEKKSIPEVLSSIDIYYIDRRGNDAKMRSCNRIFPKEGLIEDYKNLVEKGPFNPLYKIQRIKNLLAGEKWHFGMDAIFNQYPWQLFIFKDKETPNIRFFGNDIRSVFEALKDELKPYKEGGKSMDDKAREQTLELRIYRIIREYVRQKAENKSGLKIEDFKKEKGSDGKEHIVYPQKYREETEKVCSDAFLAMRGRREKDFIEYYSGTIFSVPHFLPEEDYLAVSKALMEDWEKVKTLSMLALSANSYLPKQKETTLKEEE